MSERSPDLAHRPSPSPDPDASSADTRIRASRGAPSGERWIVMCGGVLGPAPLRDRDGAIRRFETEDAAAAVARSLREGVLRHKATRFTYEAERESFQADRARFARPGLLEKHAGWRRYCLAKGAWIQHDLCLVAGDRDGMAYWKARAIAAREMSFSTGPPVSIAERRRVPPESTDEP